MFIFLVAVDEHDDAENRRVTKSGLAEEEDVSLGENDSHTDTADDETVSVISTLLGFFV